MSNPRRRPVRGVVIAAFLIALVAAMAYSTTWLTPEEVDTINPPPFVAADFVAETFPEHAEAIRESATDITVLAPAVSDDLPGAAAEYGIDLGSGSFAFPVTATGTVVEADTDYAVLDVNDLPDRFEVRTALGGAVSGTPIRDATGTIAFGDLPDQTAYQSVANEFKLIVQAEVLADLDVNSLEGTDVTVTGAWATGGPPDSYIIQPVAIEVSP